MRRCQMGSRPPDIEDPGHMFHFLKRLNGRDGVMAGYKIITPHSPEEQKNQGNPMERRKPKRDNKSNFGTVIRETHRRR